MHIYMRTSLKAIIVRITGFSIPTISKFLSLTKHCVYRILIFRLTSDHIFWYFSRSTLGVSNHVLTLVMAPYSALDSWTYRLNLLTADFWCKSIFPPFMYLKMRTTECGMCPVLSFALVLCQWMRLGLNDKLIRHLICKVDKE